MNQNVFKNRLQIGDTIILNGMAKGNNGKLGKVEHICKDGDVIISRLDNSYGYEGFHNGYFAVYNYKCMDIQEADNNG